LRFLVIIPTYNERENVGEIVPLVLAQDDRFEILIVDDNSPDGTGEVADALASEHDRVHVLHNPTKGGLGPAYVAGFRWALERDYDLIFEMDADLSHDPADLPRFLAAIAGCDLVLGSRYVPGGGVRNWPLVRRLISRGGSLYARFVLGLPIQDLTGGFKCFRRHVLETIDLNLIGSGGYGFQIEMTYRTLRAGFRVREIPIVFTDRVLGRSKMSRQIVLEAMVMVWRLRFAHIDRAGRAPLVGRPRPSFDGDLTSEP
jgi:dolichol-phosphate mannosyltransferase